MGQPILMLKQDNSPVQVDEEHFQNALDSQLEPAFQMRTPDGKDVFVRKSHYQDAVKSGLKMSVAADAEKEAGQRYKEEVKKTPVSPIESAARGAANASTFGFADEIQAAAKNPMGAAKSLGGLVGKDTSVDPDVQKYLRARNDYRTADDASYEQNPWSQRAGNVAAMLPAMAATGGAATVGQGAKMGAAQGALAGLGGGSDAEGQADLAKGNVGQTLKQLGLGAAIGGGAGALGQRMENAAPAATKDLAEKMAYRSTGGLKSDINKIYGGTPNDVGRVLLDEGVVTAGAKRGGDAIKEKAQAALGKYSNLQDEFLSGLDATGKEGVQVSDVVKKIQSRIDELQSKPGMDNKRAAKAMQSELDDFVGTVGDKKDLGFQEALDVKRAYDKGGKFQNRTEAANVEAARTARKAVKDSIDEAAGRATDTESLNSYKADRMKSKNLMDAMNAIEQSQGRDTANKTLGLTDWSLLGGGAAGTMMSHNPIAAVGTAAALGAKKIGEKYGASTSAVLLDEANKVIQKYGVDAGRQRLNQAVGPRLAEEIIQQLTSSSQGEK